MMYNNILLLYKLNFVAVKRYDPCYNNKCSQVCIPGGTYQHVCGCHRGYYLSSDGETCKGINNYYFSLTTT
jgi:hypothetical protein